MGDTIPLRHGEGGQLVEGDRVVNAARPLHHASGAVPLPVPGRNESYFKRHPRPL